MIALVVAAIVVVGALACLETLPEGRHARGSASTKPSPSSAKKKAGAGGGKGAIFEREPGVYRYETKGSETADTGLLSATHDYDGISTITLSKKGCGVVERWQVLGGRWAEFTTCPTKGGDFFELIGFVEYHEFFGEDRASTYSCTGDPASKRSARQVGKTFHGRCRSDEGDTGTSKSLVRRSRRSTSATRNSTPSTPPPMSSSTATSPAPPSATTGAGGPTGCCCAG